MRSQLGPWAVMLNVLGGRATAAVVVWKGVSEQEDSLGEAVPQGDTLIPSATAAPAQLCSPYRLARCFSGAIGRLATQAWPGLMGFLGHDAGLSAPGPGRFQAGVDELATLIKTCGASVPGLTGSPCLECPLCPLRASPAHPIMPHSLCILPGALAGFSAPPWSFPCALLLYCTS